MNHAPEHKRGKPTLLIGLTGSIGSGKSTVARYLRELGVTVLDADEYAREGALVLQKEICHQFPEVCLEGVIDRKKLSEHVFSDAAARARLEGILHPYVRSRLEAEVEHLTKSGVDLIVLEIPLLFESGWDKRLDGVLVVAASLENRLKRLAERSRLSEASATARDRAQMPQEEKIKRATWVIWNDQDPSVLHEHVCAWAKEVLP